MKIRSIQMKLLCMLVPLFLIALGILSGTSYYFSRESLSKSVDETAAAVGTDYANSVSGDVELMLAELSDLASIQRVRGGASGDRGALVAALDEAYKRLNTFDVISICCAGRRWRQ